MNLVEEFEHVSRILTRQTGVAFTTVEFGPILSQEHNLARLSFRVELLIPETGSCLPCCAFVYPLRAGVIVCLKNRGVESAAVVVAETNPLHDDLVDVNHKELI